MAVEGETYEGPYRENQKPEPKYAIKVEISMKSGKSHKSTINGVPESAVNRKVAEILAVFMESSEYGYGKHPHMTLVNPRDADKYKNYFPVKFHEKRISVIHEGKWSPVLFIKPEEIETLGYQVVLESE